MKSSEAHTRPRADSAKPLAVDDGYHGRRAVGDERNHVAKAWLHWLGFRLEEAAPYGALGLNFHRFHMERK